MTATAKRSRLFSLAPRRCAARLVLVACALSAATARADSRTPEQKQVDTAIARALEYLARAQEPSGCWKSDAYGESTATTSLAVMSFLAAGHVPGEGPYEEQIEKGIRWVVSHQRTGPRDDGLLAHQTSHGPMYSHGISTLMLAEVVGMVPRSEAKTLRRALEKAVRVILEAQSVGKSSRHAGGWRYQIQSRDSDLSVTGWQLLALRAAKNVGCDVPAESIEMAVEYVKQCSVNRKHGFAYQPRGGVSATRTGTGILALEICGEHHTEEALGAADFLMQNPLSLNETYFYYGAYYCGVGMFQMGGKYARFTRDHLRKLLLPAQEREGSWLAKGSERRVGRVYATSMSVLALAVEYQYLPIYQR